MNFFDIMKKSCYSAGEIMMESFEQNKEIKSKGENNWVTEIDIKIENTIVNLIKRDYPDSSFLAEELNSNNNKKSSLHWIIDPIDGTNNYIHDYPFFCISIGLMIEGIISHAAILDPVRNEFFYSEKGSGSYLNDKKIFVSNNNKLNQALLCTGFITSNKEYGEANVENFKNLLYKCRSIRRDGSAALDLAYVACGRLDGFWELGLNPWDTAAGILLVEEAGGMITKINGEEYEIHQKDIVASNSLIHKDLLYILECKL